MKKAELKTPTILLNMKAIKINRECIIKSCVLKMEKSCGQ